MAESSLGRENSRSGSLDFLVRKDKVFSERVSQMLGTKLSMVPCHMVKKKKKNQPLSNPQIQACDLNGCLLCIPSGLRDYEN